MEREREGGGGGEGGRRDGEGGMGMEEGQREGREVGRQTEKTGIMKDRDWQIDRDMWRPREEERSGGGQPDR